MKLRLEPTEIDRATKHLNAQELGCWLRAALHYAAQYPARLRADDGEIKAVMQCPDAAFARVKGQLLNDRPWMFRAEGGLLFSAELDAMLERARNQTATALQTPRQPA